MGYFEEEEDEGGEEEVKDMVDETKKMRKKENFDKKYQKLSNDIKAVVNDRMHVALSRLILLNKVDDYNLVSLMPLDIRDDETVRDIVAQADIMLQVMKLLLAI